MLVLSYVLLATRVVLVLGEEKYNLLCSSDVPISHRAYSVQRARTMYTSMRKRTLRASATLLLYHNANQPMLDKNQPQVSKRAIYFVAPTLLTYLVLEACSTYCTVQYSTPSTVSCYCCRLE
jgi:hypothetical protein